MQRRAAKQPEPSNKAEIIAEAKARVEKDLKAKRFQINKRLGLHVEFSEKESENQNPNEPESKPIAPEEKESGEKEQPELVFDDLLDCFRNNRTGEYFRAK